MIEWSEQHLEELTRKMGLRRVQEHRKSPIHLSLYKSCSDSKRWDPEPLLKQLMYLNTDEWTALGYTETDRVSATRHLGRLGCLRDGALWEAARSQHPLTLELAKALIDAGSFSKEALSCAACYQQPLSLELAKFLIDTGAFSKHALARAIQHQRPLTLDLTKLLLDAGAFDNEAFRWTVELQSPSLKAAVVNLLLDAGCDPAAQDTWGSDTLVHLARTSLPVDPQLTDRLLSCGCRTNLDDCFVSPETRFRFFEILSEHAGWKLSLECKSEDHGINLDWNH